MRGLEHIPWLYDAGMSVIDRLGLWRWRQELLRNISGQVLEIGCGTGRNLSNYPRDVQLIALDPDISALIKARSRAGKAVLVTAKAEALPFRKNTFDAVVGSLVFCSVQDPNRSLAEVQRVLQPWGELRLLEHVRSKRAFWAWLQDRIQPTWTWITGGCHPNRDTEAAVSAAGFILRDSVRSKGVLRCLTAFPSSDTQTEPT